MQNNGQSSEDQLPPNDPESEQRVIGCLLDNPDQYLPACASLPPVAFFDLRHRIIFETLLEVSNQEGRVDRILIERELKRKKEMRGIGGLSYLDELVSGACMFDTHLQGIKDCYLRRNIIATCVKLTDLASDPLNDIRTVVAEVHHCLPAVVSDVKPYFRLPDIEDCCSMLAQPIEKPPEIVAGLLHQGTKLVVGGGSKSFKTWTLLDLAASGATGATFWGMDTVPGRVLYVNFEIPRVFFRDRLEKVTQAKGVKLKPGMLEHWALRGKAVDIDQLLSEFVQRLSGQRYSLIIVDPSYKLLGKRDENAAGDVATLLNGFERLAVATGAAVGFGAHFSKGNQAAKDSMDRISGSGVFARDPDTILTMTKHEEEGAFTVDAILRNLPPIESFCVRWEYPLMRRVDLDPTKLKHPAGRHKAYDPRSLVAAIKDRTISNPISISAWAEIAKISRPTLHEYLHELRVKGWIATVGEGNTARQYVTDEGIKAASGALKDEQ